MLHTQSFLLYITLGNTLSYAWVLKPDSIRFKVIDPENTIHFCRSGLVLMLWWNLVFPLWLCIFSIYMTNKKGLLCVTSVGNYIIDLFNYRLEPIRGLNKCPKNTIYCMIETFHRSQGHFFCKIPTKCKIQIRRV